MIYIIIKIYLDFISSTDRKTSDENNLQLHHDVTSADICGFIAEANVDGGGFI